MAVATEKRASATFLAFDMTQTNMARNIDIHPNRMICSCRDNPRLRRMELRIEYSQIVLNLVSSENLQRHDQRVVYEIATPHACSPPSLIDGGVEDVNGAVIGASAHERVGIVELHLANGLLVISQRLVGRGGEVEIEPGEARVEASNDQIVSARMDLRWQTPITPTAMEETHLTPVRSLLTSVCLTRL